MQNHAIISDTLSFLAWYCFYKLAHFRPLFVIFKQFYRTKSVDFSRIRIHIVKVRVEHADHLTSHTAPKVANCFQAKANNLVLLHVSKPPVVKLLPNKHRVLPVVGSTPVRILTNNFWCKDSFFQCTLMASFYIANTTIQ